MSNRTRFVGLVSMAGLLVILPSAAWAQTVTGRVLGTVQDPSGAGVPAAQVTITNQDTGISSKIQTDSVGNYMAPLCRPERTR